MKRLFFVTLGLLFVAIGAVGTVLPLLPTTPFVLLGALCLARGSSTLHAWLLGHRLFGGLIRNWQLEGAITRRAKLAALLALALALGASVVLAVPATVLAIQCIVMFAAAIFIVSRPAPNRQEKDGRPPV